jgi:hypothetical protein
MIKRLNYLAVAVLFVAWGFDFFFWGKAPGISFALYVLLCLSVGFVLARNEGLHPARTSLWILLPLGLFGIMAFIRSEPFTLTINYLLTLSLMALLATTFLGGRWLHYSLSDYIVGIGKLFGSALARQVIILSNRKIAQDGNRRIFPATIRRSLPIMRGILLTIPILFIFAALLAAADPIFSQRLENITALFRIEKLPEYLFRAFYILIFAYLFAGIYLHALTASQDKRLIGNEKPWLSSFLGFTESAIVLISVNLLFSAFVIIQFRYFFGGQANISAEGFTYAEYARRGFAELVIVAFFSLLLLLGLGSITKRETPNIRKIFSFLGILQVVLLAVILASAFQRLLLYERAYGFTRLRTLTHIFMIWLGFLLVVLVILELRSKLRYFALGILIAILGFGITVNTLNIDAFIVNQNTSRALTGSDLDTDYLVTLSNDSIPPLSRLYNDAHLPVNLRNEIGAVLACRAALITEQGNLPWQSFNISDNRASQVLSAHQNELSAYPVQKDENGRWYVKLAGRKQLCSTSFWID